MSEAAAGEALWRRLTVPEKERRKLINTYRDAVLADAADRIRAEADTTCGADDPRWNGMNAAADLIQETT